MKILLAVDGSSYTKRMLGYLAAHEEFLGGKHQYTVVFATSKVSGRATAFIDRATIKDYYREETEKVFKPIRAFFKQRGIEAEFAGVVGHIAEAIAKKASSGGFDLLVMGSHGHGNFANLIMGSVANQVLARCHVPVLLVR